ncbi:hypothetical protein ACTQ11_08180 [Collinsella bouchesdurhonensis]|uniref:hypothetical protein n=1 Tax=Collinsella bouchesdurhonensis TaxID=1907654 RepID=UPI003F916C62
MRTNQVKSDAYYRTKVARHLASVGAPDADPTPLAEWAADVDREGRMRRPAIIDQTGAVIAECVRIGGGMRVGADYLTDEDAERYGLERTERGLAIAQLRRMLDRPLICVRHWEVASGSSPR